MAYARPNLSFAGRRILPALAEIGIVVVGYETYANLRVMVAGDEATAMRNGLAVLRVEQWLDLGFERPLQQAALLLPWLVQALNLLYVGLHRPFLGAAAVFLYFRNRPVYVRARRTFFIACAIGLFIFWAMPVAPPRLLPDAGFVDTIHTYLPEMGYDPGGKANEFAAIPSFHFGWNLLVVWCLWQTIERRSVRTVLALLPPLMLAVILVTANHFWLDAAIGALVIVLAYQLAALPEAIQERRMLAPGRRR
ncbi:MAG: phosphatase PAP2 family protein [Dehalococcoidia bacterium]